MMELLQFVRSRECAPDGEKWNLEALSQNPHLSRELLERYDMPIDRSKLSNQQLTLKYVLEHPEYAWNLASVLTQARLTVDEVLSALSTGTLKLEQIVADLPFSAIIRSEDDISILRDCALGRISQVTNLDDLTALLSFNSHVTLDQILAHPELPWSALLLSVNVNLTKEFVRNPPPSLLNREYWQLLDGPDESDTTSYIFTIRMSFISANPIFDWEFILSHPDYPWSKIINQRPDFTEETLVKYPDLVKDFTFISRNSRISLAFILAHPEYPWDFARLNYNTGLTLTDVLTLGQDPRCRWDWSILLGSLKSTSYQDQLEMVRTEIDSQGSYLSLLPQDMLQHYLRQYI